MEMSGDYNTRYNMHMNQLLTPFDHSRDSAALTYVYPVISRRSGGVSVGINLNSNNACNWHCLYCQVPNLTRGSAPPADLRQLGNELRGFLEQVLHGDFMAQRVPPEARRLNDIALSGNGEPTSAPNFDEVVALVGEIMAEFGLPGKIKLVLITNGSLMQRPEVQTGLIKMAPLGGEVWFKLDRATAQGMLEVNGSRQTLQKVRDQLRIAASLCPTWLQTCVFALDGQPPSPVECGSYLDFVSALKEENIAVRGVQLYGLARPSLQSKAARLSNVTDAWLENLAAEIRATGLEVKLS
jgi:wyosine [tRNA(Phe)-imidazoG37] synthetase (radical SAM superfamily)